jgi:GT2 family glycosyltransferase
VEAIVSGLTVAICTWNRATLLDRTLTELRCLNATPGIEWELLIVDNNCTDETQSVSSKHASSLPLRYVKEEEQGLSNARNRALAEARFDWVVFTDDDVLVDPGWLAAYVAEIQRADQNVVILGGEIRPWFPEPPEPALAVALPMVGDGFCARRIPADLRITSSTDYLPLGANFAVRRSLLADRRFNPDLGVAGSQRILGEEVELFRALLTTGLVGSWVPGASVQHYVEPARLRLASLRRQLFGIGRQTIRTDGAPPGGFRIGGLPSWVFRSTLEGLAGMAWASLRGRREDFYRSFSQFWIRSGVIYEHYWGSSRVRR